MVVGIILAAGKSKRMGSEVPKCFLELGGKKIIQYSIEKFIDAGIKILVVATPPDPHLKEETRKIIENVISLKGANVYFSVIYGGKERWDSFRKSFEEAKKLLKRAETEMRKIKDEKVLEKSGNKTKICSDGEKKEKIIIVEHDGARPFFSIELLKKVIKVAEKEGGAIPFITPRETVREMQGEKEPFLFKRELNRNNIALIQTPQAFELSLIQECLEIEKKKKKGEKGKIRGKVKGENSKPTDLAGLIFKYRKNRVKGVKGETTNIKITFPEDIKIAKTLLEN